MPGRTRGLPASTGTRPELDDGMLAAVNAPDGHSRTALVDRLDSFVGDRVEQAVTAKHRLRLRRLGWERALAPKGEQLWARGSFAPRSGCDLEVLIDGARAPADPRALVAEHWRGIAFEQLERRQSGARPTHRLIALPGVSRRSRRLLGPLQGLIDDG